MKKIKFCILVVLLALVTLCVNSIHIQSSFALGAADLSAKSYVVVDNNGKVLIEHNADEKREVASICKLMTTLLTLEEIKKDNLSLDDKVVASPYACQAEGSQAFLDAGSEYSIRDLLKSVIVASANDSAIVLAETVGGSEKLFVDMMNNKAVELGMNNTVYVNSTGLPANNQYSTAKDTAIILNEISDYEIYREDCKIWMDTLVHPSGRETELVNTNRLIKYYPNCITGKTGFTDEAGYCLSSTAINKDLKLTCVVLGCNSSADRFTDSVALYNQAYANFTSKKIVDKTTSINNDIEVVRGKKNTLDVVPQEDYYLTTGKNENNSYDVQFELFKKINAPVKKGDVVGIAKIFVDGTVVNEVNLVSNENIEGQTFSDVINKIADKFAFIN